MQTCISMCCTAPTHRVRQRASALSSVTEDSSPRCSFKTIHWAVFSPTTGPHAGEPLLVSLLKVEAFLVVVDEGSMVNNSRTLLNGSNAASGACADRGRPGSYRPCDPEAWHSLT